MESCGYLMHQKKGHILYKDGVDLLRMYLSLMGALTSNAQKRTPVLIVTMTTAH